MTSNSGLLDLIAAESPVIETHVTPIPAAQLESCGFVSVLGIYTIN